MIALHGSVCLSHQVECASYFNLKHKQRKVQGNQRGNQKPQIKGQTTQWPQLKADKGKQWLARNYTEN